MAPDPRRRRARRRLAAIAFLTNIPLETSNVLRTNASTTNQGPIIRCETFESSNERNTTRQRAIRKGHDKGPSGISNNNKENDFLSHLSELTVSNLNNVSTIYDRTIQKSKHPIGSSSRKHLAPFEASSGGAAGPPSIISSIRAPSLAHRDNISSNENSTRRPSRASHVSNEIDNPDPTQHQHQSTKHAFGRTQRISRDTKVRNRRIVLASSRRAPVTLLSSLIRLGNNGSSNNSSYNENNQRIEPDPSTGSGGGKRGAARRGGDTASSSSIRRRGKSSDKRQSSRLGSKLGVEKGLARGGLDVSRQHVDQADLFSLMNLEKPGAQDISYATIFVRPAKPASSSLINNNPSLIPPSHVYPPHYHLHQHAQTSSKFSPNSSPSPLATANLSGCQTIDGGQFFNFQHIHQPIYGSSNITTRSKSHYLAVLGFHTTGYCGCFGPKQNQRIYEESKTAMLENNNNTINTRITSGSTMNNSFDSNHQQHLPIDLSQQPYHAHLLDDPDFVAGKHSTVLAFPSYISSVIDHVKPADVKRELNERFRARYPNLQLTLSKLRSIKREMYQIGRTELQLDHLVIAQAYVYFEKLCLKHLITKQNRKFCAGASLMLSAKLNDIRGPDLKTLIEHIETSFRLKRRELISMEFGVIVALDFALHLQPYELFAHYERLIIEGC